MNGFKVEYFKELAQLEEKNFWFCARNNLLIWALATYFPKVQDFLEIGCGTGFVLQGLQEAFPGVTFHGSELFNEGLAFAKTRLKNANFFQMDARDIPPHYQFDVIGSFDVLEHIEEDRLVLRQMYQALRVDGGLVLTVPQHPFLWSQQDVAACHVRRYKASELKEKVTAAGFTVVECISFMSLLFPVLCLSRFLKRTSKNPDYNPMKELQLPSWVNTIFKKILNIENYLIQSGLTFPFGGSLLLIAKKSEDKV